MPAGVEPGLSVCLAPQLLQTEDVGEGLRAGGEGVGSLADFGRKRVADAA